MKDIEHLTIKKRVHIYEQDDTSMKSFKTINYIAGEASIDGMDSDISNSNYT